MKNLFSKSISASLESLCGWIESTEFTIDNEEFYCCRESLSSIKDIKVYDYKSYFKQAYKLVQEEVEEDEFFNTEIKYEKTPELQLLGHLSLASLGSGNISIKGFCDEELFVEKPWKLIENGIENAFPDISFIKNNSSFNTIEEAAVDTISTPSLQTKPDDFHEKLKIIKLVHLTILDLWWEGKTCSEIAVAVRLCPKTITNIISKYRGIYSAKYVPYADN